MALISNFNFKANLNNGHTAKGLLLGNKEGFYRDLGTALFTNNDYVRIAFAITVNSYADPNQSASFVTEAVTNNTIANSFFIGFKTPNSNLPDQAGNTKFCGLWLPPQGTQSAVLRYNGYSAGSNAFGTIAGNGSMWATGILPGSLTQPFESLQSAINFNGFGTAPYVSQVGFNWGVATRDVSYIGIQLTSSNIMTFKYYGTSSIGNTQGPYLSALKNFINNETFTSNSVSLTGSQYGNATAMFMYNPLNTTGIRVHGIAAAGFKV